MPLFKTREEKELERAANAERQERERTAKAEQEEREKYLATPVGQAEAAYEAQQMFYQFTANISTTEGRTLQGWSGPAAWERRFNSTDMLGQIEELGWHLEHVGYVFVETGVDERTKSFNTGSVSRTRGYIEGVYLFRRTGSAE